MVVWDAWLLAAWCRRVRQKWTAFSDPLATVFEIPPRDVVQRMGGWMGGWAGGWVDGMDGLMYGWIIIVIVIITLSLL